MAKTVKKNAEVKAPSKLDPPNSMLSAQNLTKAEYAVIHLTAAHLSAHGRYPDPEQQSLLAELAIHMMDIAVPIAYGITYGFGDNEELEQEGGHLE